MKHPTTRYIIPTYTTHEVEEMLSDAGINDFLKILDLKSQPRNNLKFLAFFVKWHCGKNKNNF